MLHGNEKSSYSDLSSCFLEVHIHWIFAIQMNPESRQAFPHFISMDHLTSLDLKGSLDHTMDKHRANTKPYPPSKGKLEMNPYSARSS